ncbi:MAG: hypothetical protein U9N87_11830 [Planctomycetota bacterium]|nr:hypothetical protein [Planctomycetota bacterium]
MVERIQIVGLYPISANEPCHLVEVELQTPSEEFNFGSVTQEWPNEPEDNWQVAYDEQQVSGHGERSRWVFFFHYLNLDRPLLTPLGSLTLPDPTPLPDRLEYIKYFEA